MIKKSRLRTQKQKKGRRVIYCLLIVVALGSAGYWLEYHFELSTYLARVLHNIKSPFSSKGPVRGTFYDRNLKQLAVTLERVSVYVRTREIDSIQETATRLSRVLALDEEKLKDQIEGGALRLWIAKDISQEQEISVKNLQLPGVYLQKDEKRYYPNDFEAANFIGSVENGIGLSGVEYYYDRLQADRKLRQQNDVQPLSDALDLVLTIDLKIQDILEELAKDIAQNEQAEKVAAYLLESGTGEIIGGANRPGFNPNNFTKYSQEQTNNMFLVPLCIPEKFRLFLRDATMLQVNRADGVSPAAWSLVPDNHDLGSQLRFWDWLGLGDSPATDFYVPTQQEETTVSQQKPVLASALNFGFVPEAATPLSLLRTYSILLDNAKKIHPFVVKEILDRQSGAEVLLTGKEKTGMQPDNWSDAAGERIEALFRSQAQQGTANTYLFRDDILVREESGDRRQFLINDLLFVTIPAGGNDLHMLIVVERPPLGVMEGNKEKKGLEQIVEEKVERISLLQQIAKSVADVVEPESGDGNNYQAKSKPATEFAVKAKSQEKEQPAPGVMPDLRGLSLRKSLRLLQAIHLELHIEGTGKVIDQQPKPGSTLKGVTKCVLILERQENIDPKKLSEELPKKD